MAAVKFFLVAAWYMHMKQDSRVFRRFFITGHHPRVDRVRHLVALLLEHGPEVVGDRARRRRLSRLGTAPRRVAARRARSRPGYAVAVNRLGPRLAPTGSPVVTRFQITTFSAGLLALWVASDWPIHDLAERYFFWVHMVQHTTYSIIAAPLLLIGTPTWLARWLLSPRWLLRTVRYLSRLIPATIIFNFVIIVTHIPVVVNASLHHALLHFALHTLIFVSSLIVWMPLLSPLPEVPRLQPLARMLFLFLQSVVPTVPASFLTFGDHPLYKFYETVPAAVGHLGARRHAVRRA